jgi:hypothetical protein
VKDAFKKKWLVPVATLMLTLSIGGAAFAASNPSSSDTTAATATAVTSSATAGATSGTDATTQPSGATSSNPWGQQRSDETLLTGDAAAKVTAIAQEKAGAGATIVRVETDSDASQSGHGTYEAHVVTAAGVAETIYVDSSFNYVGTETQQAGGHGHGSVNDNDADDAGTATGASSSSTSVQ